MSSDATGQDDDGGTGPYVVASEIAIAMTAADVLERAFRNRLHEVETAPGFQRLEVWRDNHEPGIYLMVSWWDSQQSFTAYMRSPAHRRSHARIPTVPERPRARDLRRFTRIAT